MQSCSSRESVNYYFNMITDKTEPKDFICCKRIIHLSCDSVEVIPIIAAAAIKGNTSLMESLIDRVGFRIINTGDEEGFTPLHLACHLSQDPSFNIENVCIGIKKLQELGAKTNTKNIYGHTPLISAIMLENKTLIDLLFQNIEDPKLLILSKIDIGTTLSVIPHELIEKKLESVIDTTCEISLGENLWEKAQLLLAQGHKNLAFSCYRRAAEYGNIEAIDFLYTHYKWRLDKHIEMHNVFRSCESEVEKGNLKAMGLLGHFYYYGIGIEKSVSKAREYFEKGAVLNCPTAYYNLAEICDSDQIKERIDYYLKAAGLGFGLAHFQIAIHCRLYNHQRRAVQYFKSGADLGCAEAQAEIGVYYLQGTIVEKDLKRAIHYLQLAADQGSVMGITWLSFAYLEGIGVTKDFEKGRALKELLIDPDPFLCEAYEKARIEFAEKH